MMITGLLAGCAKTMIVSFQAPEAQTKPASRCVRITCLIKLEQAQESIYTGK